MKKFFAVPPFEDNMSKTQTVLGWCYFPMHVIIIPLLASLFMAYSPEAVDMRTVNVVYYGISTVFVLLVMFRWLRGQFDVLLDNLPRCLLAIVISYAVQYVLSLLSVGLILLVEGGIDNPNNDAIMELSSGGDQTMKGLAIFLAPLIEETLFRGVIFGSVRKKSRVAAYVLSALLFSVYHVWQYVAAYGDLTLLIYTVQYIPMSVAFAYCYERSGSIWTPIFFHMIMNALSFAVLSLM